MTIFTAYASRDPVEHHAGGNICLADRFNWFAALLPPVWTAVNGLWREMLVVVAAIVILALTAGYFNLPFVGLYFVAALWLGFEANAVHGRALMRRGWRMIGAVNATDRISAESEALRRHGQAG